MSLISVILPFKNAASTLAPAINSILNQSYPEFELLLIDDNSTDSSLHIATAFEDKRIEIYKNPDQGIASALNLGLRKAKGTYIARMDADDLSLPSRLQEQLNFAIANPQIQVIGCQVEHRTADKGLMDTRGYAQYVQWSNSLISTQEHYQNRFVDAVIAHPTLFCKSEIFVKYGNYSTAGVPEDFELWLRWMEQGVRFAKVEQVLYHWFDYSHRLSRSHQNYASDKFLTLKAKYFARWWSLNNKKRKLWVWGYGKDVFKRSAYLIDAGIGIVGYVDVRERPEAKRNVISYNSVSKSAEDYYLVYVSDREGKKQIDAYFTKKGMEPSLDYLFMV